MLKISRIEFLVRDPEPIGKDGIVNKIGNHSKIDKTNS